MPRLSSRSSRASKRKAAARRHAAMDPRTPLAQVTYREIESFNVADDVSDDAEGRPPFYVNVKYLDTSKADLVIPEGPEEFDHWFGPYYGVQEANDAAILLAIENFRDLYMRYYGSVDSDPILRINSKNNQANGLISVDPVDPNPIRRFWVCATATEETPDDNDETFDSSITKQGWDVFLVTCIMFGGTRHGVVLNSNPIIKNKISISRNNANKYAAALFVRMTKFLLSESTSKVYIDEILEVVEEADAKMEKAAEKSYAWNYRKEFTSIRKVENANHSVRLPKTFIEVSVKRYDTDP